MATQSSDTSPEMERLQISLIREASISRRISKARSLSTTVISLSKRAIKRAHPNFSQRELDLAFLEHHYGYELSEAVCDYLAMRGI